MSAARLRGVAAALLLALVGAAAASAAPAAAVPVCRAGAEPVVAPLRSALAARRFVTYQPTALRFWDGRATRADAASLRADLVALRPYFDALVTYDAINGVEQLPAIATALGYRALVIGVWDPFDQAQVDAALAAAAAYPQLVVGLSLGNEMVFGKRRSAAALAARLAQIRRRAPRLALSTTEPFHMWLQPASRPLLAQMDFVLANVHPIFESWFRDAPDANAARFVVDVVALLGKAHCGPVLVKETGVPTAPAERGFTPARQRSFYRELARALPPARSHAFAYFAAFDAAWREFDWHPVPGKHPEEAHWGLFTEDRRPKPIADSLPRR